MASNSRYCFFLTFCFSVAGVCISHAPVLASGSGFTPGFDPEKYSSVFGEPNEFIQNFEADISPKLNEYMGYGVAVSGFILVIRSTIK